VTVSNPLVRRYGTAAIERAAAMILAGQPVAVPTETVYGLAADATDAAAVARIYEAKGRPAFNPLIIHVADLAAARDIAVFDPISLEIAHRFWPGPLTLVLPRRLGCTIAALATAGLETVAVRVPAHRAMRALLAASGRPLAAPSANASGMISATRAAHVAQSLAGRIGLVIDDGPTPGGIESTIVAVCRKNVEILRPGPVTADDLSAWNAHSVTHTVTVRSPGQLASHYAPSKPLRTNATTGAPGEYLIGFGAVTGDLSLSASGDLVEAAANLFDALHHADASLAESIAVAPIPEIGLGIAINDRLRRAAHH